MKLLIASNNKKKLAELLEVFSSHKLDIELITPQDINIEIEVEENGLTFKENAEKKAIAFYRESSLLTLADDSGLEVDALNGAPGIYSARYAGAKAKDLDNNLKLLNELNGISNRNANFNCTLCLFDGIKTKFFEGKCYGNISEEISGEGGFGYDPLFIPNGYENSFAELDKSVKNKISHRAMALEALVNYFIQNH